MANKKTPSKNRTVKTAKTKAAPQKAVAAKLGKVFKASNNPLEQLRMWNIRFAVMLVLEAIALVVLAKSVLMPVTTQYLAVDPLATEAAGHQMLAVATRHLVDLPLAWVAAAFLVLLAAVHAAVATVYRTRYEAAITRGVSETRWLGLGLAAAGMVVAVGLLGGFGQVGSLVLLAGFTGLSCVLALVAEVLTLQKPPRLISHVVCGAAVACAVLPWVIFAWSGAAAMLYQGHVPLYLYGLYATLAVFGACVVAMAHARVMRKGKWADTFFTERAFMVLGVVAVSVVAWQIYAGVLGS